MHIRGKEGRVGRKGWRKGGIHNHKKSGSGGDRKEQSRTDLPTSITISPGS